jgi:uncharacterized protein YukE
MVVRQNFGEVASLTQQHATLTTALREVFDELIRRAGQTTEAGWNTAAAGVFAEKQGAWDKAAQEWADSQGNLAKVVGQHNEDVQATDLGPASNVFNNIAI